MTITPPAARPAVCLHCGAAFDASRPTGPGASYCSRRCQSTASYARRRLAVQARRRDARDAARLDVTCAECGQTFTPTTTRQRFCSKACASRRYRDGTGQCVEPECARAVRARGRCSGHYKALMRDIARAAE